MRSKRGVACAAILAIVVAGCASPTPSPSAAPSASAAVSPSATTSASAQASGAPASLGPAVSASADHPIASSGSIAVQDTDGSLSIVAHDGASHLVSDTSKGQFGFPSWSPDGSRIAVVRFDGTNSGVEGVASGCGDAH